MGIAGDPTTAGGGVIFMNLESLHLVGTGKSIEADGLP